MLGGASGFYAGVERTAGWMGSNWLSELAEDVKTQVTLLEHLRSGDVEDAVELLESRMDDDLIAIEPDGRISERTMAGIRGAITAVRHYRDLHPRMSNRPHVDGMVAEVLAAPRSPAPGGEE